MKILRPRSFLCCLMWTASAAAQRSLVPPATQTRPASSAAKPKAKAHAPAKKPVAPIATPKPAATAVAPAPTVTAGPAPDDPTVDLVYCAYQRGMYKTAFDLATKRAQATGDPKAMTMLGELYANALGVKRDEAKAAEWY